MQITEAIKEHGKYLLKNQLPEEQPCFQENSRMSFMLVGVLDVGQDFHLVPERLLLPRGSNLTSRLLPNGLIEEQSYRRTNRYAEGSVASRDEVVLWSVSSLRFQRVNYLKWDMLYRWYQANMRIVSYYLAVEVQ